MSMPLSLTLLCLPCAGASATMYLRWRRHLPVWIKLVPVELPGRGSRIAEDFVETFDEMVSLLCREQANAMQGNYVLLGHSMGALLAYGMIRRLRDLQQPLPLALLASGSPAPSCREPEQYAGKDEEALIADLRKQGGTPEEVFASPELMRITLDALGADYRICGSFRHNDGEPLAVPLHVFAGRDDDIPPQHMQAWAEETRNSFSLDWFDGGHFFIRHQEELVLKALLRRLAGSVAGDSGVTRVTA